MKSIHFTSEVFLYNDAIGNTQKNVGFCIVMCVVDDLCRECVCKRSRTMGFVKSHRTRLGTFIYEIALHIYEK
jgi:hypothetical protein